MKSLGACNCKGHWWSSAWASRCKYGIHWHFFVPCCLHMLIVCECVNTIGLTSGSCSPTLHALWQKPEDLWALHSSSVFARPHSKQSKSWAAVNKVRALCNFLLKQSFHTRLPFIITVPHTWKSVVIWNSFSFVKNTRVIGLYRWRPRVKTWDWRIFDQSNRSGVVILEGDYGMCNINVSSNFSWFYCSCCSTRFAKKQESYHLYAWTCPFSDTTVIKFDWSFSVVALWPKHGSYHSTCGWSSLYAKSHQRFPWKFVQCTLSGVAGDRWSICHEGHG